MNRSPQDDLQRQVAGADAAIAKQEEGRARQLPKRARDAAKTTLLVATGVLIAAVYFQWDRLTGPRLERGEVVAATTEALTRFRGVVDTFQVQTGHLPADLGEVGLGAFGLGYDTTAAGYTLSLETATGDTVRVDGARLPARPAEDR